LQKFGVLEAELGDGRNMHSPRKDLVRLVGHRK